MKKKLSEATKILKQILGMIGQDVTVGGEAPAKRFFISKIKSLAELADREKTS